MNRWTLAIHRADKIDSRCGLALAGGINLILSTQSPLDIRIIYDLHDLSNMKIKHREMTDHLRQRSET